MARGKLVDTWTWRKPGVPEIKIPVRMFRGDWPSYVPSFEVSLPEFDIHELGPDLAKIKQEVYAVLETKHSITWTRHFRVSYGGRNSLLNHEGRVESWEEHVEAQHLDSDQPEGSCWGPHAFEAKSSYSLHVQEIELGTYSNGEKCWRHVLSNQIRSGWPEYAGKVRGNWDDENSATLIPATIDNRRALHRLFQAFAELDQRVTELLKPEKLQEALGNILLGQGPLALPAPSEPPPGADHADKPRKIKELHFTADPSLAEEFPGLVVPRKKATKPKPKKTKE